MCANIYLKLICSHHKTPTETYLVIVPFRLVNKLYLPLQSVAHSEDFAEAQTVLQGPRSNKALALTHR